MKTVKAIFEAEGYKYDKDARNRTHRSLQMLLDSGNVSFKVCENKKCWVKSDGTKYNVVVSLKKENQMWAIWRIYSNVPDKDGYDILKIIGGVLQTDEGKSIMKSYVDIDSSCHKCNGEGFIPAFSYYCNGICFDCGGTGFNRKFKPTVLLTD